MDHVEEAIYNAIGTIQNITFTVTNGTTQEPINRAQRRPLCRIARDKVVYSALARTPSCSLSFRLTFFGIMLIEHYPLPPGFPRLGASLV